MRAEFAFLNLAMIGVKYYESKDPCVHHRGVPAPDGVKEPLRLISPVPEALFSNFNQLELSEIFRGYELGATE